MDKTATIAEKKVLCESSTRVCVCVRLSVFFKSVCICQSQWSGEDEIALDYS